ncbi:MAG: twitching motility protein PilT [Deltaproteobacteria bacterium]|nr:twitching motility protein PilT [Deltaproteobacteria bacterium]
MRLVLDSGALIALERHDRAMWRRLKSALLGGSVPVTHGGVVGQAWRGTGPRQASLCRALAGIEVRPLDEALGRAAGELLGRSGDADASDAALVLLAEDGDQIATSDPDDLERLAASAGRHVELVRT